jgi:hypothetical protein
MTDASTRLIALLGAPDLAAQLWTVRDVRDLPADIRGAIVDVLGHEAASRGLGRDGTANQLGRELDELAVALDDEPDRGH